MLVLKREVNERIQIGTSWVKVLEVGRGWARLGIDAAPEIAIIREELTPTQHEEPFEAMDLAEA
jgi:carbon storage regulator CsrA